jgi:probable DNA metabolism protein
LHEFGQGAVKIVSLEGEIDFEGFRRLARAAAASGVGADAIRFVTGSADKENDLFSEQEALALSPTSAPLRVPPRFLDLADLVCRHKEPTCYDLLYAALLRLRETPRVLEIASDPLVRRLEDMERAVRRDRHKMTAFVRFRESIRRTGRGSSLGLNPRITSKNSRRSFSSTVSPQCNLRS